jgi:DNA-binding response OmpR family regulator
VKLLIVEDDESVTRFLKQAATEAGYAVQVVDDGLVALQTAKRCRLM